MTTSSKINEIDLQSGIIVNKNLLHNAYFPNPVNRNGKTEFYNGYGIDRWYNPQAVGRHITVGDSGLQATVKQAKCLQNIENFKDLIGKTVTLSMLYKSNATGNYQRFEIHVDGSMSSNYSMDVSADFTLGTQTFVVPEATSSIAVGFATSSNFDGTLFEVKAIKLELGDTQTLAHQENGVWVLNEIPDYAEQMAICIQYDKSSGAYIGEAISPYTPYGLDMVLSNPSESTDIRKLIYDVPSGIYNCNLSMLPNIIFPTTATNFFVEWENYNNTGGILRIKGFVGNYFTYECSVYNRTVYTEWKQLFYADGSVPMNNTLYGTAFSADREFDADNIIRQMFGPYSMKINGAYVASIEKKKGSNTQAVLSFNEYGVVLYDRVKQKQNNIFGEHNKELLSGAETDIALIDSLEAYYEHGCSCWVDADNTVHLRINAVVKNDGSLTANGDMTIGTIPVGFKPRRRINGVINLQSYNGMNMAMLWVNEFGNVALGTPNNTAFNFLHGELTYKLGN